MPLHIDFLVKAGGMRIVQKHHSSGEHLSQERDKDAKDWECDR